MVIFLYLWRTTIALLLLFGIHLLRRLGILITARPLSPSRGLTASHKANTKAGKAARTMTPVEDECYYMVNTIKEYSNEKTIIIAVLKEEQSFTYLKRKYRRRWWHLSCEYHNPLTPFKMKFHD